jgi:peptidoglycan/xylan/chitin deacetylase (PgdA/CDA1 family)
MKIRTLTGIGFFGSVFIVFAACSSDKTGPFKDTAIMKWQDGKSGAVSVTFDDGSINQFRVALPILDTLGFPATFFITTGDIPGSKYKPEFMGRSQEEIISEAASVPTNPDNLFERASLVAYAPYSGLRNYFTKAGEIFESGKISEACLLIDEGFAAVRNHTLKLRKPSNEEKNNRITWDEIRGIAAYGHEFASHTISHPRLAILDSANLVNELEGSRREILEQLGEKFTFSAECPYGTEDERVMKFAYQYYPALRNRMPEPFLEELNRSSKKSPVIEGKEYVQWQRGALTTTSMELMKSWIDTCAAQDNIWLVLVFHGVDGIGWEALTGNDLRTYYNYLKSKEDGLWVATFGNVAKYMRERMNTRLETAIEDGSLLIKLTHDLGSDYDFPITLKTYLSKSPGALKVKQGEKEIKFHSGSDDKGGFVMFQAIPDKEPVKLSFN